jgi:hypothetical protein
MQTVFGLALKVTAYSYKKVTFNGDDARIEARSWKLDYQVSIDQLRPAAPGACAASTSFDNDKL